MAPSILGAKQEMTQSGVHLSGCGDTEPGPADVAAPADSFRVGGQRDDPARRASPLGGAQCARKQHHLTKPFLWRARAGALR
jgi:hypothetical protein